MAAEWKDVWTIASAVVSRQSPPVQIFFWLGIAFIVLMFVEGLRVSFLPRRPREGGRLREAHSRELAPSPLAGASADTVFARARRSKAMKHRKLVDTAPRRFQGFRPKIRRNSSTFEPVQDENSSSIKRGLA